MSEHSAMLKNLYAGKKQFAAIAQVIYKTHNGYSGSFGLRSMTFMAKNITEAKRKAMQAYKDEGDYLEQKFNPNTKSIRISLSVAPY